MNEFLNDEKTLSKYELEYKRVFKKSSKTDLDHGDLGSAFRFHGHTYEIVGALLNASRIVVRDIETGHISFLKKSYVFNSVRDTL